MLLSIYLPNSPQTLTGLLIGAEADSDPELLDEGSYMRLCSVNSVSQLPRSVVGVPGFSGMGIVEWWNSGMVEWWDGFFPSSILFACLATIILYGLVFSLPAFFLNPDTPVVASIYAHPCMDCCRKARKNG